MECERISSTLLWCLVALVTTVTAFAIVAASLSFDWRSIVAPVCFCLGLAPLIWFFRCRNERIAIALDSAALLVAFSVVNQILSYVVATAHHPLWDPTLRMWDVALGLNWSAYLAFVNARPWLGRLFSIAYQSLALQMIVVVLVLSFQGKSRACRRFVLAFMISCLATVLIFWLVPAMGMYYDLSLRHAANFRNLMPVGALSYVTDLSALRDGAMRVISLKNPQGIISFPSFHAALGVIFAFALWNCRWLRWPAIMLNVLLIASTPVDGGHYFVDVFAGTGIALLSVAFVRTLGPQFEVNPQIALATQQK